MRAVLQRDGRPVRPERGDGMRTPWSPMGRRAAILRLFLPALSSWPPEGPSNVLFLLYTHHQS